MGILAGRKSIIECMMGTSNVQSLIDTRSQVSIINDELFKLLNEDNRIKTANEIAWVIVK